MTLLVSSVSARGRALRVGRDVVSTLRRGGWEVDVKVTSTIHDIAEESRGNGSHYVGALGGDGYLASAASGRAEHPGVLIPFPGGRGNDLCRYLGIGVDPVAWARSLAEADMDQVQAWTGEMDAIAVSSSTGVKMALGIVSLGIDATANQVANDSWLRSGPLAYAWGAFAGFLGKFRPQTIEAIVDGEPVDLGGWITSISNTGWFGGGVNILPQSCADDGVMEVLNVSRISRAKALPILTRALAMRQIDHPVIKVLSARTLQMNRPVGMVAMADGDIVGHLPLVAEVVPGALNVVAPRNAPAPRDDLAPSDALAPKDALRNAPALDDAPRNAPAPADDLAPSDALAPKEQNPPPDGATPYPTTEE